MKRFAIATTALLGLVISCATPAVPTAAPTVTVAPIQTRTAIPTSLPTSTATATPTRMPTATPTSTFTPAPTSTATTTATATLAVTRSSLALENEHFVVKYPSEDAKYRVDAEKILRYAIFARRAVMAQYSHTLPGKVTIQLYDLAHYPRPATSANADPKNLQIHFLTPSEQPAQNLAWCDDNWYQKNVVHEYTHVAVNRDMRQRALFPDWFAEGIAEYFAVFHSSSDILRKYDSNLKKIRDLVNRGEGQFSQVNSDMYNGGAYILKYMHETYGQPKVNRLVKSDAPSFWEALSRELGATQKEFEDNWLKWATLNLR